MENIKKKVYYLDRVIEIAESMHWNVEYDDELIDFQRYSGAGQDFHCEMNLMNNFEDFCEELYSYYESFDCSYEAYLWLDSTGHGRNGAPYEMIDVYNDMKECEEKMLELWRALKYCEDIPETVEEEE